MAMLVHPLVDRSGRILHFIYFCVASGNPKSCPLSILYIYEAVSKSYYYMAKPHSYYDIEVDVYGCIYD